MDFVCYNPSRKYLSLTSKVQNKIQKRVIKVELTIPVKRIETMPDRPRPSASMYLIQLAITNNNLQMKPKLKQSSTKIGLRLTRSKGKAQTSSSPDYKGWKWQIWNLVAYMLNSRSGQIRCVKSLLTSQCQVLHTWRGLIELRSTCHVCLVYTKQMWTRKKDLPVYTVWNNTL